MLLGGHNEPQSQVVRARHREVAGGVDNHCGVPVEDGVDI